MNSEPLDLSKNNFISNFPLSQPGAGPMQLPAISAVSPITQIPLHQQHLLNLLSKLTSHQQQKNHAEEETEKIDVVSDLVRKRGWDQIMDQTDVVDTKKLKGDSELDAPGSSGLALTGLDLTKSKTEDEVLSGSDSGNHSGDEGKELIVRCKRIW